MVRETKYRRGVDDLGDPAARQQAVHSHGGFSAPDLVLRHFSSLKRMLGAGFTMIVVTDSILGGDLACEFFEPLHTRLPYFRKGSGDTLYRLTGTEH
jgi:hypothetical protein